VHFCLFLAACDTGGQRLRAALNEEKAAKGEILVLFSSRFYLLSDVLASKSFFS